MCSECQLQEVVKSSTIATSRASTATSAARDALLLIKDLAFLLRLRLGPFIDVILPVVIPALFDSQKRFLCETACEVLDALVMHCSGRKLVLSFLKQAVMASREDLRLINLVC